MVGTSVALGFPIRVFGGMVEGLQRFYLLNTTSTSSTAMRTILIMLALRHGYGLLTVALITVALPLITGTMNGMIVLRLVPLRFRQGARVRPFGASTAKLVQSRGEDR